MVSLIARELLLKAAGYSYHQRETYSKEEIKKKIEEIKYLASQKKIPRLTLRKQIIHLENKTNSIFEMDKEILKQKKYESLKVAALKKENVNLKKRLAQAADKDLQKKFDQISFLLGECLSGKKTKQEIALQEKIIKEGKKRLKKEEKVATEMAVKEEPFVVTREIDENKLNIIKQRLLALKQELEISKHFEKEPEVIKNIEEKIKKIEEQIKIYQSGKPRVTVEAGGIKHTLLFEPPAERELKLGEEEKKAKEEEIEKLPLPPPPRMERWNKLLYILPHHCPSTIVFGPFNRLKNDLFNFFI